MTDRSGDAVVCLPLRSAADEWLAMGMRWMPVLGEDGRTQARRRARAARASHVVLSAAGMGGWGRLPRGLGKVSVHSAALAYARLHPLGSTLARASLPDGRLWVVATHAGSVLTDGDRVCADAHEADAWCEAVAGRFPHMSRTAVNLDDLAGSVGEDTQLARNAGVWQRMPLPFKVLPLALLAAYGMQHGGTIWDGFSTRDAEPVQVDAATAWTQAQHEAARNVPVHGESDMRAVLAALDGLPVDVAGWALRSAACRMAASDWRCDAAYARIGRAARNDELLGRTPEGWQAVFGLLDQATLSWRVDGGAGRLAGLDASALPRGRDTEVGYASRLQQIRPAFGLIGVGEAGDLPVAAPVDAEGVPLPRPAGLVGLRQRPFSVEGPLRSYVLLADSPPPMAWRELSLELTPERGAGVALSRLVARLQGVLYERH